MKEDRALKAKIQFQGLQNAFGHLPDLDPVLEMKRNTL